MSVKTTGTVKFTLDPSRPPTLTKKARARLARLADNDIDLSEIPATHGVAWNRVGPLIPEANKLQITLRIDADVLAFFRSTGTRYQTRINQVLRSHVRLSGRPKYLKGPAPADTRPSMATICGACVE